MGAIVYSCVSSGKKERSVPDVVAFSLRTTELLSLFTLGTKQGSQEKLQLIGYFIVLHLKLLGGFLGCGG